MSYTDTLINRLNKERANAAIMAEALVATFPNLGFAITNAMSCQRRVDAHRHNLVLGGIQYGAWDVVGPSRPGGWPSVPKFRDTDDGGPWEPDIGWGAK